MNKTFGILFILTGFFAIAGGFYTWGQGNIMHQNELIQVLIPLADVILTGPLSIICGIGILKSQGWATILGIATSGIYIFGSLMVFITLFWNKSFSMYLFIPAISGLMIGLGFIILRIKEVQITKTF